MKKHLILFTILATFLNSCDIYNSMLITNSAAVTGKTEKWVEYELIPSNITNNGEVFFERDLIDGSTLSVFYDTKVSMNSGFFNNLLWQDLGWYMDGEKWKSSGGKPRPKASRLYVNPKRRVAVYLNINKEHSSFKVRITK